jgi:hypothetical protein
MKTLHLLPLALLTLLLGACASHPVNKDADIDALLQAAGIEAQLSALQQPLDTHNLSHGDLQIPADLGQAVNSAIADTVNVANIHADLRNRLSAMSDDQLKAALTFYQSPGGMHVAAVESGKLGVGNAQPTPQILLDLDEATGSSKLFSSLAEQSIGDALDIATSGKCKKIGDLPPMVGIFGGIVKRAAMNSVRDNVRQGLNHRYATLAAEDVDAYLQFARSAPGQQFFAARNQAFGGAISAAGQVLAAALSIEVGKLCNQ